LGQTECARVLAFISKGAPRVLSALNGQRTVRGNLYKDLAILTSLTIDEVKLAVEELQHEGSVVVRTSGSALIGICRTADEGRLVVAFNSSHYSRLSASELGLAISVLLNTWPLGLTGRSPVTALRKSGFSDSRSQAAIRKLVELGALRLEGTGKGMTFEITRAEPLLPEELIVQPEILGRCYAMLDTMATDRIGKGWWRSRESAEGLLQTAGISKWHAEKAITIFKAKGLYRGRRGNRGGYDIYGG